MDAIKLAIQRLQNEPKIRKARTVGSDVEDAVSQLSSTVILFELSTTSDSTFIRLIELLRRRLLPLYRTSLLLTLDYIVAIFRFVHQHKLLTIKHAEEAKLSWETVLESLLSGVLDFLEENASSRHRETVASAIYPILCPLFFCGPEVSSVDFNGNLLSTVYQLLMTTVEATPRNALKLCGSELNSKHLGLTIAQIKEFLAMESLLELFALLIPPLKGGREKRTQFIKEVFDPSIFGCSDRVIRILEDIANPDWSVTSTEIMKALAETDIMFPQPFEVSSLTLNEMNIDTSSFYIDKSKFVANVDEDGKIETLRIPFSTVWKISASTRTNGEVRVTIRIMKPPILGDKPIQIATAANLSISWQLKHKFLERFGKALKHRNLKSVDIQPRQKQSKAEEISLDFQSEKQESLALRRGKVQSLSQLWADKTPSSKNKNQVNSTPLVSPDSPDFDSKPKSQAKVGHVAAEPVEDIKPGATVFVDSNGEFSFEPHMKLDEARSNNQKSNKEYVELSPQADENEAQHDDSSEDEIPQPKSKTAKSRRRFIPLSDDDDDVVDVLGKSIDDDTRIATDIAIVTTIDVHKAPRSRATEPLQVNKPFAKSVETLRSMKQSDKDEAEEQNQEKSDIAVVIEPSKQSRKRSIDVTEDENPVANGESIRHLKRLRLETNNSPTVPGRPYKGVKYGRKGRTSSPVPLEFDFDEVPRITKEPKKALMKGKNGTAAATTKRTPIKKVGKVAEKKPERDVVKPRVQQQVDTDPDTTLINLDDKTSNSKIIVNDQDEKPNRRSARVATIQTSKKPGQKPGIVNAPKKPKKAPWEETDFMQKKDLLSDAIADHSSRNGKPHSKTRDRREINLVDGDGSEPSNLENSFDNEGQSAHGERYTDYTVPTKSGSTSSDPAVPEPDSEIVMIDLTHDVSPKRPPLLKESSIDNHKKNPTVKPDLSDQIVTRPHALPSSDSSNPRVALDSYRKAVSAEKPKENTTVMPDLSEESVINRLPQSDSPGPHAALNEPAFVPQEASPPPKPRISAPSHAKIEKMESFKDIAGDMRNERSPLSRLRGSTPSDVRIKKMKSLENITDDEHNRRSSVKFDLPEIGNRSCMQNFSHDRVRSRSRTSETEDYRRETQQHESKRSPAGKKRQARSNNATFEPAVQPMDKIIDILTEINEGLIVKVARRFEGVSTELHTGQRIILEGTAQRLKEMSAESIRHFNDLVDLEAEYTTQCSAIAHGVHDFRKSTEQLNQCFKNILIEHSTRSLCKKFPSTLFPKMPEAILNPGIRR